MHCQNTYDSRRDPAASRPRWRHVIIWFPMSSAPRGSGRSAEETRDAIEAFLRNSREPALLEPGAELFPLTGENFALEIQGSRLTLQAWDRTRTLTRRVTAIHED